MDRTTWMEFYQKSPETVQAYLLSNEASAAEDTAREQLGYDYDAWERVMGVVWDLCFLKLDESTFRTRLQELAIDRDAKEVEKIVLRYVVLPLADLVLWDVEHRLQELGYPLAELQAIDRVSLRPVSYGAAVRRVAARAKVSLLTDESARRVRDILVSFLKSVRTEADVLEVLQKPGDQGGVGLTSDQAARYVDQLKQFLAYTEVISEQQYADWLLMQQREAESARVMAASASASNEASTSADDEAPAQSVFVSAKAKQSQAALAQAVEDIYQAVQWKGDATLVSRLQNLIATRLRDVRSALQIKDMLSRDTKIGGLGCDAPETDRIAQVIETGYASHRQAIMDEEKQSIARVTQQQAEKVVARKERDAQEHAQWFQDKVQRQQQDDAARQVFFDNMRKAAQGQKVPTAVTASPAPLVDTVSAPMPKLVGLSDELRAMTIQEFRRLSLDPAQAAQKVMQKIRALHDESFERGTEGVQAWRTCPLQQAYLSLVAQSFQQGRSVSELAQEKYSQDDKNLSPQEVGAILEINQFAQL